VADRRGPLAEQTATGVCQGRFRFLNVERRLPDPVDWRLESWPRAPHLWRFHLHYHDFLLDLVACGIEEHDSQYVDRAWQVVDQWIRRNRLSDPRVLADAWHPYCIARRLPVWICLWLVTAVPEAMAEGVLESIFAQARFLGSHLEWDLGGNHLLEDLRAFWIASSFFDGTEARRWRRKAGELLARQLDEQILAHGEHLERSPMYHAHILEAVLDVRDTAADLEPDLARRCAQTAAQMADFLAAICHPDGQIPLLGDSAFDQTPSPRRLISRARTDGAGRPPAAWTRPSGASRQGACELGGYWIWRDGRDFVILDAAPAGPDHLPAHAHADLLTLEISLGGKRLIVDSGVFHYQDDTMRRYCRCTAAHNVLQVDGQDQCDLWSRFRMGYRGRPTRLEHGRQATFHWVRAEHDAYRRVRVPAVGRLLACRPGGPWLCVDYAHGRGQHELTSWLHFHPDVRLEPLNSHCIRVVLGKQTFRLDLLRPGELTVGQAWYCPQFGRRIPAPVVRWHGLRRLPACCGWALSPIECCGTASLDGAESAHPVLHWREPSGAIQISVRPTHRKA